MKSANIQKVKTRIPTWMEMEINAIHREYFDVHTPKLYWPKPVREFLKEPFNTAI